MRKRKLSGSAEKRDFWVSCKNSNLVKKDLYYIIIFTCDKRQLHHSSASAACQDKFGSLSTILRVACRMVGGDCNADARAVSRIQLEIELWIADVGESIRGLVPHRGTFSGSRRRFWSPFSKSCDFSTSWSVCIAIYDFWARKTGIFNRPQPRWLSSWKTPSASLSTPMTGGQSALFYGVKCRSCECTARWHFARSSRAANCQYFE